MHPEINDLIDLCIKKKIGFVVLGWRIFQEATNLRIKKNKVKTITFASTIGIAKKMVSNGIDALVIKGRKQVGILDQYPQMY